MRFLTPGIVALILAYMLSQFYRAFLAVLTPFLQAELGATPSDLALSSGLWFIAFALMQPAVGWALDRVGPRRTVAAALALAGTGGAAVFATAAAPWHLHAAMVLLGIGCAPALMGSYYIIAREHPAARFGTLAGLVVGIGSLGNILGAGPLFGLIGVVGWRGALWGMATATLAIAALVALLVRDPARPEGDRAEGSVLQVLALRPLWFLLPLLTVSYAASAAIRGLWVVPYLEGVHGAGVDLIGGATLAMGLAMVAGNFLIGPAVRAVGSLRRTILWANAVAAATLGLLAAAPDAGVAQAVALLTLVGLSGAGYALLMAHGRAFLPAHLVGRGVTLLNMFSIAGVAAMQFGSRPVYRAMEGADPAATYAAIFAFFAVPLAIGTILYLKTPEAPRDPA